MRVADFFCGAGGFSEGFRQAGFEICFAVDKWRPAINTYKLNKPEVNAVLDDVVRISELPDDEFDEFVPDTEVIIGSPPCQALSWRRKKRIKDLDCCLKTFTSLRCTTVLRLRNSSSWKIWGFVNAGKARN